MFGSNKEIVKFVNKWASEPKKDPEIEQKISSLEKAYGVSFPKCRNANWFYWIRIRLHGKYVLL